MFILVKYLLSTFMISLLMIRLSQGMFSNFVSSFVFVYLSQIDR